MNTNLEDHYLDVSEMNKKELLGRQRSYSDYPEEKGELNVVVKRVKNITIPKNDAEIPAYKMSEIPRGLALIIEIEQYEQDVQTKRHGSHVDVANLTKLFKELHFKTTHKQNLTILEFKKELKSLADNPENESADMMILVVLSHGREGQIITSDGRGVDTEEIYAQFNNVNCPKLKGKPKFFIVQACRGTDIDISAMPMDAEESVSLHDDREPQRRKRRIGVDTNHDSNPFPTMQGELAVASPTVEDMIIAYSTIPGYVSQRDHETGTWFIQALVETFMDKACDHELIDLLRLTSEYLSKFTNDRGEKQTCNIEMRHLYKKIYLKPGTRNDRRISDATLSPLMKRSHSTPPSSPKNHRKQ